MSTLEEIEFTEISDGLGGKDIVKKGDVVDLKPVGENNRYFLTREFLEKDGPYLVDMVGRWPCGRTSLCLNLGNRSPTVYANELQKVTS